MQRDRSAALPLSFLQRCKHLVRMVDLCLRGAEAAVDIAEMARRDGRLAGKAEALCERSVRAESFIIVNIRKRRVVDIDPCRPRGHDQPRPRVQDLRALFRPFAVQIRAQILCTEEQRLDPRAGRRDRKRIFYAERRFDQRKDADSSRRQTVFCFQPVERLRKHLDVLRGTGFGQHDEIGLLRNNSGQTQLQSGDIVAISHKIVSKAEGRLFPPDAVKVSDKAHRLAERTGKTPEQTQVILNESKRVLWARKQNAPVICQHKLGLICANAGVDLSNARGEILSLPLDPDATAAQLREELEALSGVRLGVIICDTHGRPFREGAVGVTIGASGVQSLMSYIDRPDRDGRVMLSSVECLADELASAATLLMGQSDEGRPVVVLRGLPCAIGTQNAAQIVRPEKRDLFLQALIETSDSIDIRD